MAKKPRHPMLIRRLASRKEISAMFDRLDPCGCSTNQEEKAFEICDDCRFAEGCGMCGDWDDWYCKAFVNNANRIMDAFDKWAKEHPQEKPEDE